MKEKKKRKEKRKKERKKRSRNEGNCYSPASILVKASEKNAFHMLEVNLFEAENLIDYCHHGF